jgi:hypothetical protein
VRLGCIVDDGKGYVAEADEPFFVVDLFEPDWFSDQSVTHEEVGATPFNGPIVSNHPDLEVTGIRDTGQLLREGAI